jgi:hypothetical protein
MNEFWSGALFVVVVEIVVGAIWIIFKFCRDGYESEQH